MAVFFFLSLLAYQLSVTILISFALYLLSFLKDRAVQRTVHPDAALRPTVNATSLASRVQPMLDRPFGGKTNFCNRIKPVPFSRSSFFKILLFPVLPNFNCCLNDHLFFNFTLLDNRSIHLCLSLFHSKRWWNSHC